MVTFFPRFEAGNDKFYEVIVVLDVSNSMAADDVVSVKQAAIHLLSKLPRTSLFNVTVFGSSK